MPVSVFLHRNDGSIKDMRGLSLSELKSYLSPGGISNNWRQIDVFDSNDEVILTARRVEGDRVIYMDSRNHNDKEASIGELWQIVEPLLPPNTGGRRRRSRRLSKKRRSTRRRR